MNEKKDFSEKISQNDKERYYSFFIMTYNTNESDIQPLLEKAHKWAWIKHDKDNTPEHLHIICTFRQNKSEASVKKLIQGEQNTFCEVLKNKYKAFEYLTHENEDETKAPYSESEIHCNDTSYFQKGVSKSVDNEEFLNDLIDPNMPLAEKLIKYGKDFARNYVTYAKFARLLKFEKRLQERFEKGELIKLPDSSENVFADQNGEVVDLIEQYKKIKQEEE